ncbi:glycosyltransferase family 2 protein [Thermodesulfovibrio sp. 3907-1M]|uniref:Beta-monoglucosyldiacylglycerol synthase n=1 Tax=Thermodesulfovibrio autotrophicus TaxID=3118333 RepID=A0AAU8GVF3_9BACT
MRNAGWRFPSRFLYFLIISGYIFYILHLSFFEAIINCISLCLLSLELFLIFDTTKKHRLRKTDFIDLPADYKPFVSILVPICREPAEVVKSTLTSLSNLDYENYEVYALVNNTPYDKDVEIIRKICNCLGEKLKFFYIPEIEGAKAGVLNYALRLISSETEIIGIIDSDYVVERDFLKKTVGYFKNQEIAVVQLPQDYFLDDTPASKGMYHAYRYFFSTVMNTCNEYNAASFMGTMGLIRRSVLERIGGFSEEVITEDSEIGIRIHELGYKTIYIDRSKGKGLMPYSYKAYKKQRARWVFGNMQTIMKNLKFFISGKLNFMQKLCYLAQNTIWFNNLFIPFWIIIFSSIGLVSFSFAFLVPYLAFLLSRSLGFFFAMPANTAVSLKERIYAFISFLSLTLPMATEWIKCLIYPKKGFWRTPKFKENSRVIGCIQEGLPEFLILLLSGFAFVLGILKNQVILATGAFINGLIYFSVVWQIYGFFKLSRKEKDENWINFATLEETAS